MNENPALRIVQYLPAIRLEEGGVVRAVLDLCAVLARRGNQVTLVTWDDQDVPSEWKAGGAGVPRVVKIDRAWLGPFLGNRPVKKSDEAIASADVVHLHAPWTLSNLQWAGLALNRRVPYVVTVHGMLDEWSMRQKRLKKQIVHFIAVKRFLERAARVHCTAEGELEQAKKWFPKGQGVALPLVMDLGEFKGAVAKRGDEPKILFLSRLHPKKGVEHLIEAGKRLQEMGIACKILIAGSGEAAYEAALRRMDERVSFLGMVKGAAKISLYESADVFVLPTSQENFGLAIVEAMACGTPVMTTRGVDIWPEIQRAGAVIVSQSAEEIAAELKRLLGDRIKLKEMGARQREFVFQWLDIDKVASQYEQMYRDVMQQRN